MRREEAISGHAMIMTSGFLRLLGQGHHLGIFWRGVRVLGACYHHSWIKKTRRRRCTFKCSTKPDFVLHDGVSFPVEPAPDPALSP